MSQTAFRYNVKFWLLCLSSYLFFASFNMIIPELPSYLTSLGGEAYKGLIIGLFTVAAFISRPFSGKLADTVGRIPVIFFGSFVCVIMGVLYPFVATVGGFLVLRLFHGFSTGFQPTGTTAYVADIVPFNRRGEALGLLGVAGNLGMASGPAIGSYLAAALSLDIMFFSSAAAGLLSVTVLAGIPETHADRTRFRWSHLAVWREPIYDPLVKPAVLVMILTSYCFGLMLTIIPDFSDHLSIDNRGLFFAIFTGGSIVSRLVAGKASDIYGRVPVLIIATLTLGSGMASMAFSNDITMFTVSSVLFGLGTGMITPTLFAWTVDLGDDNNRAKSIATVYMGLEAGIFSGSVVSAFLYNNKAENFNLTFLSGAILCLAAFLFLMHYRRVNRAF